MTTSTLSARPATRTSGLPIALGSAAAFGLAGPLAASLLQSGWSPASVVLGRLGGAAAVLLIPLIIALRRTGLPSRRQSVRVLAYGMVAVAGAQLCYFSAVQRLSVGVALLLEYLGPVLLIGWHWLRFHRRPARAVLTGAAIAIIGMALVLDLTGEVRLDPVGVVWALGAAVCLAAYFELASHGSDPAGPSGDSVPPMIMTAGGLLVGTIVIGGVAVTGLLPTTAATSAVSLAGQPLPWWVPVTVLALVSAVLAYLTGIVAVRRLGASVASFVGLTEVIFAVIFAIILLGQQPSPVQLLGGALVIAGIALVQRGDRSTAALPDDPATA